MSTVVTLIIPDDLARRARELAAARKRPLEDVVLDWIEHSVTESAVELLPDRELLVLCDAMMQEGEQVEMSDLLAEAKTGGLSEAQHERLDELLGAYRRGLVTKAR